MHKKYFIGWDNIKFGLTEIIKTFSAKESFFSSKRIERALFVMTALSITIATAVYLIKSGKMDAMSCVVLISPLLLAAGYNIAVTEKAKNKSTDKSSTDGEI